MSIYSFVNSDIGNDAQSHDFKSASFTIPTTCDLCQATIWGIAKQGFTCKGIYRIYYILYVV